MLLLRSASLSVAHGAITSDLSRLYLKRYKDNNYIGKYKYNNIKGKYKYNTKVNTNTITTKVNGILYAIQRNRSIDF